MICSRYHIVEIQVAEVEQVSWQANFVRGNARCDAGRRLWPLELACKIDLLIVGDCLVRKHEDGVLCHGILNERENFRYHLDTCVESHYLGGEMSIELFGLEGHGTREPQ